MSKKFRQQLDEAGFTKAKIYASSDLDEKQSLEDAKVLKSDVWGIGTHLITAVTNSAWLATNKLCKYRRRKQRNGGYNRISNNAEKYLHLVRNKYGVLHVIQTNGKSEGDHCAMG